MLSENCKKCGTPLFKYEGQIICPKCDFDYKEKKTANTSKSDTKDVMQNTLEMRWQKIRENIFIIIEKLSSPSVFFSNPEKNANIILMLLDAIKKLDKVH